MLDLSSGPYHTISKAKSQTYNPEFGISFNLDMLTKELLQNKNILLRADLDVPHQRGKG